MVEGKTKELRSKGVWWVKAFEVELGPLRDPRVVVLHRSRIEELQGVASR